MTEQELLTKIRDLIEKHLSWYKMGSPSGNRSKLQSIKLLLSDFDEYFLCVLDVCE